MKKLTLIALEKICGGKEYLTVFGFNKNMPAALVYFPEGYCLAFNPWDSNQVSRIIKGNPVFYGTVNLDERKIPYITFEDLRKFFPCS